MTALWKWIVAGSLGLLGLLALFGSADTGARVAAYLRKRDAAEAKARAAANEALAKLKTNVVDANKEANNAGVSPADSINGSTR